MEGIEEILSVLRPTALDAGVVVDGYMHTYREQGGREFDRREAVGTTIRAAVDERRGTARESADGAQQIAGLADEQ